MWIDHKPNPEVACELCERGVAVRRAMSEMPAKWRQTLELAYFGGMTQIEIAEVLGEPLGTVKTNLFRARAILKERLEKHYAYSKEQV